MSERELPRAVDTSRQRRKPVARIDFVDADRAIRFLTPIGLTTAEGELADAAAESVVRALGSAADPDQAALLLARLAEVDGHEDLIDRMKDDTGFAERLIAVLGCSRALGEWLCANVNQWRLLDERPEDFTELLDNIANEVGADLAAPYTGASGQIASTTGSEGIRLLRIAYRRALLDIAGRDLSGELPLEHVADRLSDLAGALVQTALAVSAAELGERAHGVRLCVIGMGKCGAHELNYISDVDVIFVGEPIGATSEDDAMRNGASWASALMRICKDVAWEVDAALRPEGKAGALVRTLEGHRSYYSRWARTWEFQALLKARPIAGDADLGADYMSDIASLCWQAADREGFVEDVQSMRRRVEDNIPEKVAARELKLGPGGLRDIEFSVQLLQMVHGRADESIHYAATLEALGALTAAGYVGREDGRTLADSYRFLRTLEHRVMLTGLRRTHLLPDDEDELRALARSLGYSGVAGLLADRESHAREVRRLHEKVFYRPLLTAVAAVPGDALTLTTESAAQRLRALGFERPEGVLKHVEALTAGTSRTAALQRIVLPAILSMFADAPDPDGGVLAYRRVSEQLGRTPWYLRLLRDEGAVSDRLARVLGSSRYVADLLGRAPEAIQMFAESSQLEPRMVTAIEMKMFAAAGRAQSQQDAVSAIRSIRRHELVRIASADILHHVDVIDSGVALSALNDATIRSALSVAAKEVGSTRDIGMGDFPCDLAVIGMGRYGGAELGYGSDADVMYVYEPRPDADPDDARKVALQTIELMIKLLAKPGADPAVGLDADLRPEGRNGVLVRSLDGYASYYERWSQPWEAQALLRARPAAGDVVLGARFGRLIDKVRYPVGGLSDEQLYEIRRIKARVDAERLPRGADPNRHLKLGRGGLSDIEWTVQLFQLQHGNEHPALRTPSTLNALRGAVDADLIGSDDAHALAESWRLVSKCRDAIMLAKAKASDELPRLPKDLVAVARLIGYPDDVTSEQFLDDYSRTTRRARNVAERLFYGEA